MSATKTVTITGWIVFNTFYAKHPDLWPSPYRFSPCDERLENEVAVQPHSFTVEVPADFDPRPGMVANLEAEKRKVQAEFAKRVTDIERQISELQAIEFSGGEFERHA